MTDSSRAWVGWVLLSLLILYLGMLIGFAGLGQFRLDTDPLRVPLFYWRTADSPLVRAWLARGTIASMAIVGLGWMIVKRPRQRLHGEARWAREVEIRREGLRSQAGLVLGLKSGKPIAFGGTEHVLLEAPTRAGKGVGVVIPNLLTWSGSVVVLDVKQENWEATAGFRSQILGQRVLLFDPLDPEGRTVRFNPLAYIRRDDEIQVINELQKLAGMLFPPSTKEDSFWADSARNGFIGVGAYVASETGSGDRQPLPFTIGEIYRQLTAGDPKARFPKIIERRRREELPLSQPCEQALFDFTSSSDNTFSGIRQSITAKLSLWINPYVDAATSESDFDFRDFRSAPTSLYLGVSPDNIERVSDLYNLLFQQLVDLNVRELPTSTRHNVPLLVLLDEFARLGRASTIAAGFSYVAGYGIRLLPVIQSRAQLRAIYGKDITDEIIANCGVEVVFTPKELEMANEISARLGTYTFAGKSRSHKTWDAGSGSVSTSEQRRPLLLPQELMQFPRDQLILLRGGIPPVKANKITYYSDRFFTKRAALAPPIIATRPLNPAAANVSIAAIERDSRELHPMSDEEAMAETIEPEAIADPSIVSTLQNAPPEDLMDLIDDLLLRGS